MADFYLADANPVNGVNAALDVVLFGKIYDVAPDGTKTLVHRLVSPVRVADLSQPVHINLPGQIHRYAAGHHLQFLLATTDNGYIGSKATHVLTIAPDAAHPATVTLRVLQNATDAANAIPVVKSAGANREQPQHLGSAAGAAGLAPDHRAGGAPDAGRGLLARRLTRRS